MLAAPASSYFSGRAPFKAVVERASDALRTKTGFSLIRVGEGEGPVLCWPDYQMPGQMTEVLQVWFGRGDLAPSELTVIADGLRQAVRSADVLGLPTPRQVARLPRNGMVMRGIAGLGGRSPSQLLTDANVQWYLQWSGALAHLLRGRDAVSVIGPRDLGPQIATTFGVGTVRTYLVRAEPGFPGTETKAHWPGGFDEILRRLSNIQPGEAFLVGAGVLGKIYCDRIKSKGGVALDIGSLLDGWAKIPSRERYQDGATAFTLDHFKSVGDGWENMFATLKRCVAEFQQTDATIGADG